MGGVGAKWVSVSGQDGQTCHQRQKMETKTRVCLSIQNTISLQPSAFNWEKNVIKVSSLELYLVLGFL